MEPTKPETLFTPSVPPQPPAPVNQTPQPSTEPPDWPQNSEDGKKKKILIILGGVVGLLVLIIIIALIVSSGGKKTPQAGSDQNVNSGDMLSSPSALDIQNADNSISSDITGLNDDSDFPTANLSDDNLEL